MSRAKSKLPLVLLPGWGVNQAIWAADPSLLASLTDQFDVRLLDLPGYGFDVAYRGSYDLNNVAARVLEQTPSRAIWVGWSLGAVVAMHIALAAAERLIGLQLISPTPRFLNGDGWNFGMELAPFEELRGEFAGDYAKGLKRFLTLQTADRRLIRRCLDTILTLPRPSVETIDRSLDLLAITDQRKQVGRISVPTQIVYGMSDRIVSPDASLALSKLVWKQSTEFEYQHMNQLNGGHLCFLENTQEYFQILRQFTGAIGE